MLEKTEESRMDIPEIHKTQDENKQNKNTTQYVLVTTMCKQIPIT